MTKYTIQETIDWAPSFYLMEIVIQKECFFCLKWVLRYDWGWRWSKRKVLSFKITTSNESSLFMSLQGIAPENSWLGWRLFEGLQNCMQNKNEVNEKKIMFWGLVLWIKWTGMVKIKQKNFKCAVPIMPCLNSSWIMSLRIYGEGKTQIPLSSPATIGPLPRIQDRQSMVSLGFIALPLKF